MTIRTAPSRAMRVLVLLATAWLGVGIAAPPARAASAIDIEARPMTAGTTRSAAGWRATDVVTARRFTR